MSKITVRHPEPPEKPVKTEILAEAIVRVGKAFDDLAKSGLNERAIIVLVHDATKQKVSKGDIKDILDAMKQLRAWYCR